MFCFQISGVKKCSEVWGQFSAANEKKKSGRVLIDIPQNITYENNYMREKRELLDIL